MKQFEYFIEQFTMDTFPKGETGLFKYLNEMGSDGWELCVNNKLQFIFKKEVYGYPISQGSPQVTGVVSPHH